MGWIGRGDGDSWLGRPDSVSNFLAAAGELSMTSPRITLNSKASKLATKGQAWFFADDLKGGGQPDGIVRLTSDRGHDLGLAFHSSQSRIRVRRCGAWPGEAAPTPEAFFATRLDAALASREHLTEEPRGVRLVHGESDQLPGLVVDRYDRCLVLQSTSRVVEKNLSCIVPYLRDKIGAISVLARNDVPVRRREGLPEEVRLLDGRRVEAATIQEHGVRHIVRLFTGQKTGFFLDQRRARRRVIELAEGREVADLCSYQGAFSLAALQGGATSVLAVDQSEGALELLRQAADGAALTTECADIFDWLRQAREAERKFGLIVLDPPAFAKSKREIDGALNGYRDLNRLALRILAPGGYLLTCSCSHHVSSVLFEGVLRQAATDLPFPVWLRERIAAGEDHPVSLSVPESEYLKVVLLQRAP
jgi:23S rRNA (cytosine1962-C5)-methyltransferase